MVGIVGLWNEFDNASVQKVKLIVRLIAGVGDFSTFLKAAALQNSSTVCITPSKIAAVQRHLLFQPDGVV